jgi:CTP:molybdopterin cytidylyltransferase MocA
VVFNPEWASGLASSIRVGLAALLAAEPGLDAVLVALCDQPALSPEVIGSLAALHRATGRIAAARYGGRNGAPAVFGRGHLAALGALDGDEGARRMLNGDPEGVAAADLPEMGADLDTPADCRGWASRHSKP